jgi:hypothetical protein
MIITKNRSPIHSMDGDGRAIVLVPLANHAEPARLFAEDFDRLMEGGVGHLWTLNSNGKGNWYVRACSSKVFGNITTVARLIADAGRGQCVRHEDGNRLNLRADNLTIERGYAKTPALLPPSGSC